MEPTVDLVILDSDSTLGDTWSQKRLYPGLLAEAHHGYEVHAKMASNWPFAWYLWALTID